MHIDVPTGLFMESFPSGVVGVKNRIAFGVVVPPQVPFGIIYILLAFSYWL